MSEKKKEKHDDFLGSTQKWDAADALPSYLKSAPWYYPSKGVDHLRIAEFSKQKVTPLEEHYTHGQSREQVIHHWKPGCCKNCGSPDHNEFECLERPRKLNARAVGTGIGTKEVIESHDLSFEAKRDQYSNVNTNMWWLSVGSRYSIVDRERGKHKSDHNSKILIHEEYGNRGFRNREDVPAYIQDISSTNPALALDDDDLFVKSETEQMKGKIKPNQPHTISALSGRETREKFEAMSIEQQHHREYEERLKLLQTSKPLDYITFEPTPKSQRYGQLEDLTNHGHKSVWGSWYNNGEWGYACCHQTEKNCSCTAH